MSTPTNFTAIKVTWKDGQKNLDLTLKDYKPLVKFVNKINKIKANQELQKYFYDRMKYSPQVILYEQEGKIIQIHI